MPLLQFRYVIASLLIASISFAPAQEEAGSTLAGLKSKFVEDMRTAIAPAGVQYLAELQKLELKFALAGRFEDAIVVRNERAVVAKFLGDAGKATVAETDDPHGGGVTSPERVPVDPKGLALADTSADISDGAQFTDKGLALSDEGATASWKLGSFAPGGYEVEITYSSSAETSVQVRESFFRLSGKLPSGDGELKTAKLGTLKITSRSDTISLTHTGEEGSDLIIHSIHLISTKD